MADAVKINELPDVGSTTFGPEDQFIVNDISTGTDGVTRKISVGSFLGWITSQDLQFTGTIELGNIIPASSGLNMTVDGIYVKDYITIDPLADVNGIDLDDLEDVQIDEGLLTHGQVLQWDSVDAVWTNEFIGEDNAGDTVNGNIQLLRDSIDTLFSEIQRLEIELEDLNNSKVDEAPSDGQMYVMMNGSWVALPETFSIDRDL